MGDKELPLDIQYMMKYPFGPNNKWSSLALWLLSIALMMFGIFLIILMFNFI